MATSQQQLVCDSSTLANFKAWAQAISNFFTTAGWTQSADTGQVNWGTIVSVPGSAAFVYEVWKPGDGLAAYFLKVEYGNVSGTNCPSLRLTISTTTNGAGTPTGLILGPWNTNTTTFTPPSTTTQFECNFSGDSGRMQVMMWRNGTNTCQQAFSIERSVNSSGTYTGSHVTLVAAGNASSVSFVQQTLLFGVGAGPASPAIRTGQTGGLILRMSNVGTNITSAFNGSIPFDTIAPNVGFFDYPLTGCGAAMSVDIAEGVTFTATLYGATRTYMPSFLGAFSHAIPGNGTGGAFCMRFD